MEKRNGIYTSQTRSDDCDRIVLLAKKIQRNDGDITRMAREIEDLASQLSHELS